MRIFATDLDGTLLDREGRVHPRDAAAIVRARAAGIVVTIATGRLTTGTLPIAASLGLDAPLVCADGGVLACGASERILSARPIPRARVIEVLAANAELCLASFVFTSGAIHSCELGTPHHPYVSTWSPAVSTHEHAALVDVWQEDPHGAVMVLGIGETEAVDRLVARMAELAPDLDVLAFFVQHGRHRVARFITRGVSKGTGLAELASSFGVGPEAVAVVGDWHNDRPMFAWAGRSFAMPHAPAEVKAEATHVVGEGGVAEALDRWMAELAS